MLKIKRMQIHWKSVGLKQMVKIKQKKINPKGMALGTRLGWSDGGNAIPTYHTDTIPWPSACCYHPGTADSKSAQLFSFIMVMITPCASPQASEMTALSVIYLAAIKPQKLSVVFLLMYTTRTCHSPDVVQRENGLPSKYITDAMAFWVIWCQEGKYLSHSQT